MTLAAFLDPSEGELEPGLHVRVDQTLPDSMSRIMR